MFCWHKYKTGDIRKYKGMSMTPEVHDCLLNHNAEFIQNSNGVGSKVGFWNKLIYHVIPDSVIGANITGESDIHDNGFELPRTFETLDVAFKYFKDVNYHFLSNMRKHFSLTKWHWLRRRRMARAEFYYNMVETETGWVSFMDGKTIGGQIISDEESSEYYNKHEGDLI